MIREETVGAARLLTFCRPEKKNALDRKTAETLKSAIGRASDNEKLRGIVLAAEGDVFVAGGDLGELATLLDEDDGAEAVLTMGDVAETIEDAPLPILAAVDGGVYGGGCELLLMCDDVIAGARAQFSFRHGAMGLVPAWGGTTRLIERVGALHASNLLLTGELIDADHARAIGFVSEVTEDRGATIAALARLKKIARADRASVAALKESLVRSRRARRGQALEEEKAVFRKRWGSDPHRAAMTAFKDRK